MASADFRSFRDPLAPLRRQREWQVETARAHVAALHAQLADCERMRRTNEDETAAQSACAARLWETQGDPVAHRQLLAYLGRLQAMKVHMEKQAAWLRSELAKAQQVVMERQVSLEVMDRHRRDAVADFAAAQGRHLASQADESWLARRFRGQGLGA